MRRLRDHVTKPVLVNADQRAEGPRHYETAWVDTVSGNGEDIPVLLQAKPGDDWVDTVPLALVDPVEPSLCGR